MDRSTRVAAGKRAIACRTTRLGLVLAILVAASLMTAPTADAQSPARPGPGEPEPTSPFGAIPAGAEIVFHQDGFIFVMDRTGQNVTQITFDNPREYEHIAVSRDRDLLIANEQLPNPTGDPGGRSVLCLYDPVRGTETRLLADFVTAGHGGVAFGPNGFIYFAAKESDVFSNPSAPEKFNSLVVIPPGDVTEMSLIRSDGAQPRLVFVGGAPGIESIHDPELSPDNTRLIFSRVNPDVPPNFPDIPAANTAHDIYSVALDGSGRLRRPLVDIALRSRSDPDSHKAGRRNRALDTLS